MSNFIKEYTVPEIYCDDAIIFFNSSKNRQENGLVGKGQVRKEDKESIDIHIDLTNDNDVNNVRPLLDCIHHHIGDYLDEFASIGGGYGRWTMGPVANLQYYKPNCGFKRWHFERASYYNSTRGLVWLTYLTDTQNAGTEFYYQNIFLF